MPEKDPSSGVTAMAWLSDLINGFFPKKPETNPLEPWPMATVAPAAPRKVPPGAITGLKASSTTPSSVALSWTQPSAGTKPFGYLVLFRTHGSPWWGFGATATVTGAVVSGLMAKTTYDFEIITYND